MGNIRLGSLFGIEVRIDLSWFLIFFLILWTFSFGVFPASFPGLSIVSYIAMGLVGTLLFFIALLVHEFSHSLVARAKGVPVPAITLFIFGGISHTSREAESPGDELLIAIVGPLSSFGIAAVFGAVAWIGAQGGWSPAVTGVAEYLAIINVALAVFNLVPGFPLDGGRVLRAAIWKGTGDVTKATRIASTAGKVVGYVLIALGIWQIFRGFLGNGIWLAFIGWFLRNAAAATYEAHVRRQRGEAPGGGEFPRGRRAA